MGSSQSAYGTPYGAPYGYGGPAPYAPAAYPYAYGGAYGRSSYGLPAGAYSDPYNGKIVVPDKLTRTQLDGQDGVYDGKYYGQKIVVKKPKAAKAGAVGAPTGVYTDVYNGKIVVPDAITKTQLDMQDGYFDGKYGDMRIVVKKPKKQKAPAASPYGYGGYGYSGYGGYSSYGGSRSYGYGSSVVRYPYSGYASSVTRYGGVYSAAPTYLNATASPAYYGAGLNYSAPTYTGLGYGAAATAAAPTYLAGAGVGLPVTSYGAASEYYGTPLGVTSPVTAYAAEAPVTAYSAPVTATSPATYGAATTYGGGVYF